MRDIRFRAWNKDKQIMVYDDEDKSSSNYWDGVVESPIGMINRLLSDSCCANEYEFMQYTGLKDKHGREIREGDIIRTKDHWKWPVGCVNYNEDMGRFDYSDDDGNYFLSCIVYQLAEVIGNKRENPELLTTKLEESD